MQLQPNIGSDRSWVWKVHADYADGEAKSETLAIRFANAESKIQFQTYLSKSSEYFVPDASLFKEAFENAKVENAALADASAEPTEAAPAGEVKEEHKDESTAEPEKDQTEEAPTKEEEKVGETKPAEAETAEEKEDA